MWIQGANPQCRSGTVAEISSCLVRHSSGAKWVVRFYKSHLKDNINGFLLVRSAALAQWKYFVQEGPPRPIETVGERLMLSSSRMALHRILAQMIGLLVELVL